MRRTKPIGSWKFTVFLLLTAGLTSMGAVYGAWTAKQTINVSDRTGAFLMALSDGENPSAFVVTENDSILTEIADVFLDLSADRRSGTLRFDQEIPVTELLDGAMLQLIYPIEPAKNGTFGQVQPIEPDFTVPSGTVELTANSADFDYGVKKMEFYLYQGLDWEGEQLLGSIWLRLTPEGAAAIQNLPPATAKTAKAADADAADANAADAEPSDEADVPESDPDIIVRYTGDITILMDQYGVPAESPYIAYAYWTDQLTITCEVPLCYPTDSQEGGLEGYGDMEIPLTNDLDLPPAPAEGGSQ